MDLLGWEFGSWRVFTKLEDEKKWLVKCSKCHCFFKKNTRDLTRRKRRPYGCKKCNWGHK